MIINYQSFLVNLLITDSIKKHSVRISFPGLRECKYINISLAVKFDGKFPECSVLLTLSTFLVTTVTIF